MAQPNRGDRVLLGARVPREMGDVVKAAAERKGFRSVSDYLASLAAHDVGYVMPDPRDSHGQEALPLTG